MAESTLLPEVLQEAITGQITVERTNASVYAQLDIVFRKMAWFGMAKFMQKSGHEETEHAERFIDFLDDRNVFPDLDEVPAPEIVSYTNPMPVFVAALELEKSTTQKITALYLLADSAKEPATCLFLQWYLDEQMKSEKELLDVINQISHGASDAAYLNQLDEELGK